MIKISNDFKKPIVICAITGSIHTPTLNPNLPVTPEEMIEQGVEAAQAGASIIHVHARDPETGKPNSDIEVFRKVAKGIKERSDAVFCPTTGGSIDRTVEESSRVVSELEPEMATCNLGSMNFGLYPMARNVDEWRYDWEEEYLKSTKDLIFTNTFEDLEKLFPIFRQHDTKPELECYDVGHIYNLKQVFSDGFLEEPLRIQFVMGVLGGIGAHPSDLIHMKNTADRIFGDKYSWSVLGAGKNQFPITTMAANMSGDVRVGMEDNLYVGRGEKAKNNVQQVKKIKRLLKDIYGKEPATPDEVRDFLGLKGLENVSF